MGGGDKMYMTASEWREEHGGKRLGTRTTNVGYKSLAFDCCALTFQPFETPVATRKGHVYDALNLLSYLAKHGKDPCTGDSIHRRDLINVNMIRNADGKYHCPVTFKVFTPNTHIVLIATTGNVFSFEAVNELNIKPKNWLDLISGEPFKRSDIVHLQDPVNNRHREQSNFHYVRTKDEKKATKSRNSKDDATAGPSIQTDLQTEKLLATVALKDKERSTSNVALPGMHSSAARNKALNAGKGKYAQGLYTNMSKSGGFTSTSMDPTTESEYTNLVNDHHVQELRYDRVRKLKRKGYARLITTHGDVNIELHYDMCPRTCENFATLAKRGYYDGTLFHRLIPGFMVQGGDPTGTGKGGDSMWGEEFNDEIDMGNHMQRHDKRGVLSMANSGKDTNGSQFFITFKECQHLDKKHTVFGRVVGGMETLDKIEAVKVSDEEADRPMEDIIIKSTKVFQDPVEEMEKLYQAEQDVKLPRNVLAGTAEATAFVAAAMAEKKRDAERDEAEKGEGEEHDVVKVNGQWTVVPKGALTDLPAPPTNPGTVAVGQFLNLHSSSGGGAAASASATSRPVGSSSSSAAASASSGQVRRAASVPMRARAKPKKRKTSQFGDFSAW